MRSPTAALLWEIWRRNRIAVAVIVAATVAGRLLDYAEQPTDDPSSLIALLSMVSFLFLFGIFSYTEPSGTRGIGCPGACSFGSYQVGGARSGHVLASRSAPSSM